MRDYFRFGNEEFGQIQLIGDSSEDTPMWLITHYLNEFCDNYNKILIVSRMCQLFHDGAVDQQFLVSERSIPVLSSTSSANRFSPTAKYIHFTSKGEDAERFWHIVFNYRRPNVFFRDFHNDNIIPLIDFNSESAIKITSLSYHSPPQISAQGIANAIIDLVYAGENQEMKQDEHDAAMIGEAFSNYERYARATQTINDPRTPPGVKHYVGQQMNELLKAQARLNKKLGMRENHIDRNV